LVVASHPASFELLPLRLTCQDCVLTLLLIYRPPSSSVTNFPQELLDLLDEFITAELLVGGDFNLPGDCLNTIDTRVLDVLEGHNITHHVQVATHISGGVLDLVATSVGKHSVTNIVSRDIGISDHYLVQFHLMVKRQLYRSM